MQSFWIRVAAVLLAVWLVIGGILWWVRSVKPSPEKLVRYIETHQLDGKSPADRARTLEKVSQQLNALTYEQRREIRGGKRLDRFFRSLTPEEQLRFLDQTLPSGFRQMMEAFNKMEPRKRKQFVERTLREMKQTEGDEAPPNPDDPHVQKIINEGLRSFYSDASAEVKLDFAPLIEQMQSNFQGFR